MPRSAPRHDRDAGGPADVLAAKAALLRVYAYHASLDGTAWQMIRVFLLDDETSHDKIGFEGQSPTGDGCSVVFDEIRFLPERLAGLRDGS